MDARFSNKERRSQPEGGGYAYVDSVFDIYPIFDGDVITGIETVDGKDEIRQSGLFCAIAQRGSDPLDKSIYVRWAESLLGEVSQDTLVSDIKDSVAIASSSCAVTFGTETGKDGVSYLTFSIQVVE